MHHKENIASHVRNVITALAKLCADYENIFLLGDFNFEIKEKIISDCMSTYNLKSLVKQKTSFKNPDNPSCIDLTLTNSPRSFQDSSVFKTGLSDFHKLTTRNLSNRIQKTKKFLFNLLKKAEKDYFANLDVNSVLD